MVTSAEILEWEDLAGVDLNKLNLFGADLGGSKYDQYITTFSDGFAPRGSKIGFDE
tara:strand:+ start:118 stop:285 length:168 start_codon:yes stop_codon:yes gene_type:complete